MTSGKLNIWIRDEDCSLRNRAWRADLEVKTCLGENLIDMLPHPYLEKIFERLKQMYPEATVTTTSDYGPKTIRVEGKGKPGICHLEVEVPPGSYVVRAHVCGVGNEWSDRTMVIVTCGDEVCINLVVKEAETCGREFIIPFLRLAEDVRIPRDQILVAVNAIVKASRTPVGEIAANLQERAKQLKGVKEAGNLADQAESGLRMIKSLRLEKEK